MRKKIEAIEVGRLPRMVSGRSEPLLSSVVKSKKEEGCMWGLCRGSGLQLGIRARGDAWLSGKAFVDMMLGCKVEGKLEEWFLDIMRVTKKSRRRVKKTVRATSTSDNRNSQKNLKQILKSTGELLEEWNGVKDSNTVTAPGQSSRGWKGSLATHDNIHVPWYCHEQGYVKAWVCSLMTVVGGYTFTPYTGNKSIVRKAQNRPSCGPVILLPLLLSSISLTHRLASLSPHFYLPSGIRDDKTSTVASTIQYVI
ncbi:hypothetical protein BDR04DRAFT_1120352 [Suillus decipiens]|nr:hypothetical protein BDR04DRAFT_1120352 [Suillus decipiens]